MSFALKIAKKSQSEINAAVENAAKILQLSEQNNQIGEIVKTVNDLAEQSNLLAVNASMSAHAPTARAPRPPGWNMPRTLRAARRKTMLLICSCG